MNPPPVAVTVPATASTSAATGPVLCWKTIPADRVIPAATRNFRARMCGSPNICQKEAGQLADEVIARMTPILKPVIGECDLLVDAPQGDSVRVSGCSIPGGTWAARVTPGDPLKLYCLTSGSRLREAEAACSHDPVLSATAHLFGSEIIFEMTRLYDRRLRHDPHARWRKLGLMSGDGYENSRCRWDPGIGRALFRSFAGGGAPVFMTEAGSFDPVHSVLGMFCRSDRSVRSLAT
jgi:hypothetical protein